MYQNILQYLHKQTFSDNRESFVLRFLHDLVSKEKRYLFNLKEEVYTASFGISKSGPIGVLFVSIVDSFCFCMAS
jgi:hypothetical protein